MRLFKIVWPSKEDTQLSEPAWLAALLIGMAVGTVAALAWLS